MAFVIIIMEIILITLRNPLISVFTTEPLTVAQMVSAWPVICCVVPFFAMACPGVSVVRATKNQGMGALITCAAYWVVGIPCALLFGNKFEWGLSGVWMGNLTAVIMLNIGYNLLISFGLDWPDILQKSLDARDKQKMLLEENRKMR